MKIILVVPNFPKLSETFIASKVLGLLKQGWDVQVVCNQSDPAEWTRYPMLQQQPGLRSRVHVTWPHRPRWLALLLTPAALGRAVLQSPKTTWRYIKGGWLRFGFDIFRRLYLDVEFIILKPDLIHFEFGSLAVDRLYLRELLDAKLVISFRGYDLNYVGLEYPGYYKELWDQADGLHLLGQDLWRRAQQRGCTPDKLHALIPPAIDPTFFDPGKRQHDGAAGTPVRPLRILSVGRLEWKKGYEHALQAVQLLENQRFHCEYHIVGGGDYLEAVAFARHQLDLEQVVRFLEAQPHEAVKVQMLWADIFLHPAVSEGFSNAVMEAQAMALPVVCTDADGLPDNVVDGKTGYVVPRRNPQALAEKLIRLAQNPALRQRMGQAGRQRVLTYFRLEDQNAAFEQLYRQVLSRDQVI